MTVSACIVRCTEKNMSLQNQLKDFISMCLLFSDITKMQSQQSKASPNPNSPIQPESTGPRQQQRKVQQKKKKKGGKW